MIIYADDTTFSKERNHGEEFIGVGCLLLGDDISQVIIDTAMNNLRNDPDIHEAKNKIRDNRTLQNGYFHAADDSPNAHSWLCTAINQDLCGNFQYSYSSLLQTTRDGAWKDCLEYIAIMATQSVDPVQLFIERRSAVEPRIIRSVFEETCHQLDLGTVQYYAIPRFYPQLEITVVDKNCPGIQIVDFLLWAKNRTHFAKSDMTWEGRLNFTSKSAMGLSGGMLAQGNMVFKHGCRENHLNLYPKEIFPLPDISGDVHCNRLFVILVSEVLTFLFQNADSKLNHIQKRYSVLKDNIEKNHACLTSVEIEGIASCFLCLFDMRPVYCGLGPADQTKFQRLIQARRFAARIIGKTLIVAPKSFGVDLTKYQSI